MDIFFKLRVEATEQMALNCMGINIFRNPRIKDSEKPYRFQVTHIITAYVVVISCFNFTLRLKSQVEGTSTWNLLLPHFFDIERMSQNVQLKIYERKVSSASLRIIYAGY